MFDYRLALATGVDIPMPELQLTLHQPTIREISMIGEEDFFMGIQLLCLNKTMYLEDESLLQQTTNFQIFMTMMNEKELVSRKETVLQVLALIIPQAKVMVTPNSLFLSFQGAQVMIDDGNFEAFQKLLREIFCLNKESDQQVYNPANKKAKEIADKIMAGRRKVAAINAEKNKGSMLGQYLSVLTVALGSMSLQDCCQLTMYQLYDLVERYSLYLNWDLDIKSRLAGGKPDKPAENWMKNIHN